MCFFDCSNTESIRDVQFSPQLLHAFAAVSENGNVQLWDVRRPDKCTHQFTAHSGPVFACDWHPECNWLATASRDKTIKVIIPAPILLVKTDFCKKSKCCVRTNHLPLNRYGNCQLAGLI